MFEECLELNIIIYLIVLDVCLSFWVVLKWGKEVYGYVWNVGFVFDFCVGIVFVNMYVKGGSIDDVC